MGLCGGSKETHPSHENAYVTAYKSTTNVYASFVAVTPASYTVACCGATPTSDACLRSTPIPHTAIDGTPVQ